MLRPHPGSEPACPVQIAAEALVGADLDIFLMLTTGPEASEYTHEDVWRSMTALGIDVTRDEVVDHRQGRCDCRRGTA